jgi:serine/threonine protein kinase
MSIIKWENELSNNQGILYSKEHLLGTLRTIYESLDNQDTPDAEKLSVIRNTLRDSMYLSFQAPKSIWNGAFKNVRFIKQGGFGEVFKGIDIIDNCMYAIKKITIRMDPQNTIPYARLLHKIREVRCLSILDHPNIIRYYHSWVEMDNADNYGVDIQSNGMRSNNTPSNSNNDEVDSTSNDTPTHSNIISKSQSYDSFLSDSTNINNHTNSNTRLSLYIKMEYMQFTLAHLLQKQMLDIPQRVNVMFSILSALYYMHHLDDPIIHRDIKPDNILVSIENNQITKVKVVDFGLFVYKNQIDSLQISLDGTSTYMPPDPYPINTSYDIYSFGIVLFECIHSFTTQMERHIKIQEFKNKPDYTNISMIDKMVRPNSNDRPSIQEILTNWNHHSLKKDIIQYMKTNES